MRLTRRFSIAGLMVVILVASLTLAALRSASATSAGGRRFAKQVHIATQKKNLTKSGETYFPHITSTISPNFLSSDQISD
jgi:hypothetical protein